LEISLCLLNLLVLLAMFFEDPSADNGINGYPIHPFLIDPAAISQYRHEETPTSKNRVGSLTEATGAGYPHPARQLDVAWTQLVLVEKAPGNGLHPGGRRDSVEPASEGCKGVFKRI
jgi:hypothetical protein